MLSTEEESPCWSHIAGTGQVAIGVFGHLDTPGFVKQLRLFLPFLQFPLYYLVMLRLPSAIALPIPQCCANRRNTALMKAWKSPSILILQN